MSIRPPKLPSLSDITTSSDTTPISPLATALTTLFEPSPVLFSTLVPAVHAALQHADHAALTYNALIDLATLTIVSWSVDLQAAFIAAHPRIGEVTGLSELSAQEQASRQTSPEVLARLGTLNATYERKYEGLRYITFVNGRSRREVMEEMESVLGYSPDEEVSVGASESVGIGSEAWACEVRRAVSDVGKIAKSRLSMMDMDGDVALGSSSAA